MAIGIKTLNYKVNQESQQLVETDNVNTALAETVQLYRGESIEFNFAIVNDNNAPQDYSTDDFLLTLKDPQDMGGDQLASTTDDTGSVKASGLIRMTIDLNTTEMNDFINFSTVNTQLKMELSAINGGIEQRLVFQFTVQITSDANQLIISNVTLTGATTPIVELNPDTKIDATAIAQTTIFTIPTGVVFIPLKVAVLITDITVIAAAPFVQFGTTADPDLLLAPVQILANGQYETQSWDVVGAEAIVAGEVLEFGVTTASTAATEEFVPSIEGYFLSV